MRDKVRAALSQLSESHHLQGVKWRGDFEGVHVDVYIPHQSQLGGKLRLKVEVLAEHTELLPGSAWRLLTIEAHTITKFAALLDRPDTEKGFKDAREILRLLELGVEPAAAGAILLAASATATAELPDLMATAFTLLTTRSGANKAQRERIRRWQRAWVAALQSQLSGEARVRPTLE